MQTPVKQTKPVMLWDGACAVCERWITRWQRLTGDAIVYRPYQAFSTTPSGHLEAFPRIHIDECRHAVQFVMPDGTRYQAAEAVFRSLHSAGKLRWLLWAYLHIPGFKWCAERLYRFVARHRFLLRW